MVKDGGHSRIVGSKAEDEIFGECVPADEKARQRGSSVENIRVDKIIFSREPMNLNQPSEILVKELHTDPVSLTPFP